MTRIKTVKPLKVVTLIAVCIALTGCGGGDSDKADKKIERGIVTSALECADDYNLDIVDCQAALQKAIAGHESSSTTYTRLHRCEEAEGAERCERAGQKTFSRRLQAFLIGITKPLLAAPLYPTIDGTVGFVREDGTVLLLDDDIVKFSEQATIVAESNANLPKKKIQGGL